MSFLGFGEIISALKTSMTRDFGWFVKKSAGRIGSTLALKSPEEEIQISIIND